MSLLLSPETERTALQINERRRANALRIEASITAGMVNRAIDIGTLYPSMSPALSSALIQTPVPLQTPAVQEIALRDAQEQERESGVLGWLGDRFGQLGGLVGDAIDPLFTAAKGVVRGGALAFETVWEEAFAANVRAAVLAGQEDDLNFFEARKDPRVGTSAGVRAVQALSRGDRVNIGSGFFANSDLAPDVQERLAMGESLAEAVAQSTQQAALGDPFVQQSRNQANTGVQLTSRGGASTPVSLGRLLAIQVTEPGTQPFNLLSGAIDAGTQLTRFEPSSLALTTLAKANRANKAFRAGNGLIEGAHRKAVLARRGQDYLTTRPGQNLVKLITETTGDTAVATIRNILRLSTKGRLDRKLLTSLADSTDEALTSQILLEALGTKIDVAPTPTSLLSRATGEQLPTLSEALGRVVDPSLRGVGGISAAFHHRLEGTFLGRMFSQMPGRTISVTDMDRGIDQLDDFLNSAGFTFEEAAKHLDNWARLESDDWESAFGVLRGVLDDFAARLATDSNISPSVIRELTTIFDDVPELRAYFVNQVGDLQNAPWLVTMTLADGNQVRMPTAQLLTEYFDNGLPLPDPRRVRNAVARTGNFGGVISRLTTNKALQARMGVRALDTYMTKVWKPFVLLRAAWPVRITGEEQVRMGAAGLDSAFSHPLSWMAYMTGRKGAVDAFGDDIAEAIQHQMAMNRMPGIWGGGSYGSQAWVKIPSDDPDFVAHWARELNQLWSDPIVQQVAFAEGATGLDQVVDWLQHGQGNVHLKELLSSAPREKVEFLTGLPDIAAWKASAGTGSREGLRELVESINARMHLKAGGRYEWLDVERGAWMDDLGQFVRQADPDDLAAGRPRWIITQQGNEELLSAMRTGKVGEARNLHLSMNRAKYKALRKELDRIRNGQGIQLGQQRFLNRAQLEDWLNDASLKLQADFEQTAEFQALAQLTGKTDFSVDEAWQALQGAPGGFDPTIGNNIVRRHSGAPSVVKGTRSPDSTQYDKVIDRMYAIFGSVPTNKLSRSPAFRQFYWQKMAEMAPYMTGDVAALAARGAQEAGFGFRNAVRKALRDHPDPDVRRLLKEVGDITKLDGAELDAALDQFRALGAANIENATLYGLDDADRLAKVFALEETKNLLYDVTRRRDVTDIMRNFFPFAEAWSEIITAWSQIMYRNPVAFRRMTQAVEGARGSGFFYENENGEEVFAYPGGGMLSATSFGIGPLGGFDLPEGTSVQFEGRTQGLNLIAGSYIPGFGPAIQMPASFLIPDLPQYDQIREAIIPFGPPTIESAGDFLELGVPAYFQRALAAIGIRDGNQERLFSNTVGDVLNAMYLGGEVVNTPEGIAEAQEIAKQRAQKIWMIRAVAQFGAPSAPQVTFEAQSDPTTANLIPLSSALNVPAQYRLHDNFRQSTLVDEDVTGEWFAFQSLAEDYFQMLEDNGWDDQLAFKQFTSRYGLDPSGFATAKTTQVRRRPVTEPGLNFIRQNEDLVDSFPNTVYFLAPDDPDDDFEYAAYLRAIRSGDRQPRTPEEWAAARNDLRGRVAYDYARSFITDANGRIRTDKAATTWLQGVRADLIERYPGYFAAAGPEVPTRFEKITELKRWQDDQRLLNHENPDVRAVAEAVNQYLAIRGMAVQAAASRHGVTERGLATAKSTQYLRDWLLQAGEALLRRNPDFGAVWSSILRGEVLQQDPPSVIELLGTDF